jgi:hypothetical protein
MSQPLEKYPPPLVRLYLLDRFSQIAQFPSAQEIFSHLNLASPNSPIADAVAQMACRPFMINGNNHTLPDYLAASPAMMREHGRVEEWSKQLVDVDVSEIMAQNDRSAARDAATAATRAHFLVSRNGGDLEALRFRAIAHMRACFSTGVRAGSQPVPPRKSLADLLFDLREEEILFSSSSKDDGISNNQGVTN